MANDVKILISAVDHASKVFKDVSKAGDEVKSTSEKMKDGFLQVGAVLGTIAVAAGVAKKAMDMGREGASAIQTGESFDFLMKKVGAAPGLLDKLTAASKGTISELDLMSSTSSPAGGRPGGSCNQSDQLHPAINGDCEGRQQTQSGTRHHATAVCKPGVRYQAGKPDDP